MRVSSKTKLSEVERDGEILVELYIEPYQFDPLIELSDCMNLLTESYELTIHGSGPKTNLRSNTTHNIKNLEGVAFRLPKELSVAYSCRLTDWEYDDTGELEEIIVPEEPYDEGDVILPTGSYRVWEQK